jgi:hypothetical protein
LAAFRDLDGLYTIERLDLEVSPERRLGNIDGHSAMQMCFLTVKDRMILDG